MRSQDGSTSKPSAAPRLVPNLLHPQTDIHITLWYNVCQIYIINIRTWIWLSADYSRRPRVSSSPDSPPPPPYFSSSSKVLMIVIEPRFSIDSTSQQSRDNRSEAKQRNVTILFHLRDLREAIRSRVSLYILLFPEIGGEWECETMDDLLSNKIVVDKKKRIVFNYRISNEHTGKNVQRIDGGGRRFIEDSSPRSKIPFEETLELWRWSSAILLLRPPTSKKSLFARENLNTTILLGGDVDQRNQSNRDISGSDIRPKLSVSFPCWTSSLARVF